MEQPKRTEFLTDNDELVTIIPIPETVAADELPPRGDRYPQTIRILGHGAAELTDVSDPDRPYYDC